MSDQAQHFDDYLSLNGRRYEVLVKDVPQASLKFYLENPRLYSIVWADGKEPTEEEILEQLEPMEHVRALVRSIKEHGGLIDPVIVRADTKVVLEGNSRLAAYRILNRENPIKWGKIRARFLPAHIDEKDIFALLGEYHIRGKKDWAPYEQAGFLYRRHKNHDIKIEQLAEEIKMTKGEVAHLISVYEFMLTHKEKDTARWSYYDEYLKGKRTKTLRKEYGEAFDKRIVAKVRSKEIPTAMDLRDGLRDICKTGGKSMHKFAEGTLSFDGAWKSARRKGANETALLRIERFKKWLAKPSVESELLELTVELQKKCRFSLDKLVKRGKVLAEKLT